MQYNLEQHFLYYIILYYIILYYIILYYIILYYIILYYIILYYIILYYIILYYIILYYIILYYIILYYIILYTYGCSYVLTRHLHQYPLCDTLPTGPCTLYLEYFSRLYRLLAKYPSDALVSAIRQPTPLPPSCSVKKSV